MDEEERFTFRVPSLPKPSLAANNDNDDTPPSFPLVDGPQRVAVPTLSTTSPDEQSTTTSETLKVKQPTAQRKKVILSPGHSPLDWAALTTSGKDFRGVQGLGRYTLEDIIKHNKKEDAWCALQGKVYNITPYMEFHPGGVDQLMRGAGRDATKLFMNTHAWVNAEYMLDKCLVGFLVNQ